MDPVLGHLKKVILSDLCLMSFGDVMVTSVSLGLTFFSPFCSVELKSAGYLHCI